MTFNADFVLDTIMFHYETEYEEEQIQHFLEMLKDSLEVYEHPARKLECFEDIHFNSTDGDVIGQIVVEYSLDRTNEFYDPVADNLKDMDKDIVNLAESLTTEFIYVHADVNPTDEYMACNFEDSQALINLVLESSKEFNESFKKEILTYEKKHKAIFFKTLFVECIANKDNPKWNEFDDYFVKSVETNGKKGKLRIFQKTNHEITGKDNTKIQHSVYAISYLGTEESDSANINDKINVTLSKLQNDCYEFSNDEFKINTDFDKNELMKTKFKYKDKTRFAIIESAKLAFRDFVEKIKEK